MTAAPARHAVAGSLTPVPPFDFAKSLAFLEGFQPMGGEQSLAPGALAKAVTLNGRALGFELRSTGSIERPCVAYTLYSESPIAAGEQAAGEDRIRFFLSLDDDLATFYAIGRSDPPFVPVIERLYGLHHPKFLTPFELACWAILGQRVPWRVAHEVKLAIVDRWGTSISLPDGRQLAAFPEPQQLLGVDSASLAEVVRNERKVEYLAAVTRFFAETDESWLRYGDYDLVAAALRGIHGIGEWSAHFILLRGLGRIERISTVDRELAQAAAAVYNRRQPMDEVAVRAIADRYGPVQGYWGFYIRNAAG